MAVQVSDNFQAERALSLESDHLVSVRAAPVDKIPESVSAAATEGIESVFKVIQQVEELDSPNSSCKWHPPGVPMD